LPFTPIFDASTLFAGQVVATATDDLSNHTATALSVTLAPQTVVGAIANIEAPICLGCWSTYVLTLPPDSWLAALTGQTQVTVYFNNAIQAITTTSAAITRIVRFNGFLFENNGSLVMVAVEMADGPGTPIGPSPAAN
jgi:hypothetical protein